MVVPTGSYPLDTDQLPIVDLDVPGVRCFPLRSADGVPVLPAVKSGDSVDAGQPLCTAGDRPSVPSPVPGEVVGIVPAPDIRGARAGLAVLVEPGAAGAAAPFPALDPEAESTEMLAQRLLAAGIMTDATAPELLTEFLAGIPPTGAALVVQALDREPGVRASLQLYRDRPADSARATRLLAHVAGGSEAMLAVPDPLAAEAESVCRAEGVAVLPIMPVYPDSLEPLVARRADRGGGAQVVALETALAALDAVREGRVQDRKVVTVIGPNDKTKGNYRVPIGARLGDILAALDLTLGEGDKVVAGGPMRGFAQYAMEAAIDAGIDALIVQRHRSIIRWSDEPCINCGACIDVCPAGLQVQLIGRYSEFGLFDRAGELRLDACFECGLCASACTARRPLLQLIRQAKAELQPAPETDEPGVIEADDRV